MAKRILPAQSLLLQLLKYDPETGLLYWLERTSEHIADPRILSTWNARYAGRQAFSLNKLTGYVSGTIGGVRYPAQRVIWKMVTGEEPDEIDHIDGDTGNNRLCNLRNVSHAVNGRNQKRHKNNSSGTSGVHLLPSGNYHVRVNSGGMRVSIGTFCSLIEAERAKKKFERLLGYHENHGRN